MVYTHQEIITKTLNLLNEGRPKFSMVQRQELENILECYETVITKCLKKAEPELPVTVKAFSGLHLICKWIPSKVVKLYGKPIETGERLFATAKFTKHFNHRILNNH